MTTTELSDADILWLLNVRHINLAAQWVANRFATGFLCARVELTPGDATSYQIMVAAPQLVWPRNGDDVSREYVVALVNLGGASYPWSGQQVHPSYAAQKWAVTRWSGVVVAAFLTALAGYVGDQ